MSFTPQEAVKVLGQKFLLQEGIAGISHHSQQLIVYVETPEAASKIPQTLMGYPVKTIISGKFKTLALPPAKTGKTLTGILANRTLRFRPVCGGVSIGSILITAGTNAGRVVDRDTGMKLFLSNRHVFMGDKGTPVVQPGCLPPQSFVLVNFGASQICKINEDVEVLGTEGFVKVIKTMSRPYEGEMIRIKPCRNLPFDLTPEHPVLVIETEEFKNGQQKRKELSKKPKWKSAKGLTSKDFLLIPRIKEIKEAENIKIVKYRYYCKNCGHAWRTYNKPKKPKCGKCNAKGRKIAFKGSEVRTVNVNDPDFAFLVGLFIADGTAQPRQIHITLTKGDNWFIEKTKYLFHRFFGKCAVHNYGNIVRVECNSKPISDWFKENCHQGKEKKLPSFAIYMPTYWLKQLMEGLLVGDGKRNKKFGTLFTTSKILAYQLSLALAKIGAIPNITMVNPSRTRNKCGKIIQEREGYEVVCLPKHRQVRGFVLNDFVAVQVEKVESYEYEGMVYNLETEDNTYCLPFVVHNSYDGGSDPSDRVATVERWVNLKPPPDTNIVDAALALPLSQDLVSDEVLDIGVVNGIEEARVGMRIRKSGRSSGLGEAVITDTVATVKVDGYSFGEAIFEDTIITSFFGLPGDSGSCCINAASGAAVGLLFAGSDTLTCLNKMTNVVKLLNVDIPSVAVGPSIRAPAMSYVQLPFAFGLALLMASGKI